MGRDVANPPFETGRIYAAEILRKLPPGSWVLGEDGRWRQK